MLYSMLIYVIVTYSMCVLIARLVYQISLTNSVYTYASIKRTGTDKPSIQANKRETK